MEETIDKSTGPVGRLWPWAVIALSVLGLLWLNLERRSGEREFPRRAITILCPYSAGGGTDLLSRKVAQEAEKRLDVSVLVSNVTGGGGAVGHAAGRIAPPDGHTVLMTVFELLSLPEQGLVPFTHEDFDLLLLLNRDPAALAVRADHPAESLEEFIALAREGDPPLIANTGAGSSFHLSAALFCQRADLPATHVPQSGAAGAVTALLGGHVDAAVASPAEMKTYADSGQLRLLGVMSGERIAGFEDVPTMREQGVDAVFGTWRGLALPKGVPEEARSVLLETFRAVIESEAMREFAAQSGMNLDVRGPEAFREMVEAQSADVAETMEQLGLRRQ
jgi:tripartite-type tricarboxylate transporter receptor subunit TctC